MTRNHSLKSVAPLFLALFFCSAAHAQTSAPTPDQSAPGAATLAPAATTQGGFLGRPEVRNFIAEMNTRLKLPTSELELALGTVAPIPQVIDLIKPPANPGVRSWQRYRSRFLDRIRIDGGKRFLAEHAAALKAAEEQYGVPKEIIVSIIGVETVYGRNTGNFNTVAALATLAFDYPPRAELFRRELESLFLLAHERGVNPLDFKGSYAGALGLPQFLPSSIRAFAVDFDHDGVIDLRGSPADAIGSVASYLQQNGWQRGGRIVLRAYVKPETDLSALLAPGLLPSFSPSALSQAGVSSAGKQTPEETAALIDLVTPGKPTEYWLGLQNFYVITRYNRSSFYAMAVNDLAEAFSAPAAAGKPSPAHHK
ncbi:lytic murein transglycosylase B [Uliginosibacterium sp. H3]|uniref:Lytic murein transglycosylase B n=1 Tax=Uliginosibacterium silvisoli TaxID=3114758 RepID=A0ABU6K9B5_9RHOO|nr:lytic murein transglycosylase B [Uliginosibacterium sp. H3]